MSIAVQGVLRDLNHPISTMRQLAQHSFADWSCIYNKCRNPFLHPEKAKGRRRSRQIPAHMQTALRALKSISVETELKLGIDKTDQSEIFFAEASKRHLRNLAGGKRLVADVTRPKERVRKAIRESHSISECLLADNNPLLELIEGPKEFTIPRKDRRIIHFNLT